MEKTKSNESKLFGVLLPGKLVERVERIRLSLEKYPYAVSRVTLTGVVRLAVAKGLAVLEREIDASNRSARK